MCDSIMRAVHESDVSDCFWRAIGSQNTTHPFQTRYRGSTSVCGCSCGSFLTTVISSAAWHVPLYPVENVCSKAGGGSVAGLAPASNTPPASTFKLYHQFLVLGGDWLATWMSYRQAAMPLLEERTDYQFLVLGMVMHIAAANAGQTRLLFIPRKKNRYDW